MESPPSWRSAGFDHLLLEIGRREPADLDVKFFDLEFGRVQLNPAVLNVEIFDIEIGWFFDVGLCVGLTSDPSASAAPATAAATVAAATVLLLLPL